MPYICGYNVLRTTRQAHIDIRRMGIGNRGFIKSHGFIIGPLCFDRHDHARRASSACGSRFCQRPPPGRVVDRVRQYLIGWKRLRGNTGLRQTHRALGSHFSTARQINEPRPMLHTAMVLYLTWECLYGDVVEWRVGFVSRSAYNMMPFAG